jgi:DNA-binding Lrp family transcriptional regulator
VDELDVRIFRALTNDNVKPSFFTPLKTSLREIARKLQVDDVTVRNRYKRLREKGVLSWKVLPNPNLFGYRQMNILVDTPPKSPKEGMIRKLKLVHGMVAIFDLHGDSLGMNLLFDSDQSLSRTIELISRITNAENITQIRPAFPAAQTNRLTETDWAIVRSLEGDASKSYVQVAKELGITARTVKNRLLKLELNRALMIGPTLNVAAIDGMIGLILFYSYSKRELKDAVDQTILSRFGGSYLWATLDDPDRAYLILVAPTMASVKSYLKWTKEQVGVAGARAEIVVEDIHLWNNAIEVFQQQQTFLQSTLRRTRKEWI